MTIIMRHDSATSANLPRIIIPRRHADDRGWFSETYNDNRLGEVGISCRFVQDNQSSSKRAGTLRGLHFQCPPAAQAKLVSVLRGRIFDVAVDIRRGSPTFGKHVSKELSAKSGYQLYVPIGFAHGFISLDDDTLVLYKVSDYYVPAQDSGVRWDDPEIAIQWPFKAGDIIMSDKDQQLPLLKELASPFAYDGYPLAPLTVLEL